MNVLKLVITIICIFNQLGAEMVQTPEYLYKLVSLEQWQESQLQNQVVSSAIDQDFIHLAKEDQIAHVAQKFWGGQDYIVLMLASDKLIGQLVYETNPGGSTQYYHLYNGDIPLDAVIEAIIVPNTNK